MAKLAILFLTAVAFQAAFAGVHRHVGSSDLMMTWNRDVDSRDFVNHIDMFFKSFCQYLEYKDMDKDMILCCIQKFVKFLDLICDKLECTTCTDQVFIDCITICKNIKMECENILKCTDFHEMKMLFVNCLRMYCMEFNKWCMHEEFLVRYMKEKVCSHLYTMFDKCMTKDFTHFMSEHMMNNHMMGEYMMGKHMMNKHMMGGKHMMDENLMNMHMMDEHMMGEHMMGKHMMGEHTMSKHMMGKHMMGEHMMSENMMSKHMMGEHMMGEHMMANT
ncbi:hypothetical protein FQR65_LT11044 [Abscondita terminalis]|nr:hypothetical protein FQR65_LT11044 [Abscondita terminalis]